MTFVLLTLLAVALLLFGFTCMPKFYRQCADRGEVEEQISARTSFLIHLVIGCCLLLMINTGYQCNFLSAVTGSTGGTFSS
jgi:uncharacterized membrane protein YqhA